MPTDGPWQVERAHPGRAGRAVRLERRGVRDVVPRRPDRGDLAVQDAGVLRVVHDRDDEHPQVPAGHRRSTPWSLTLPRVSNSRCAVDASAARS